MSGSPSFTVHGTPESDCVIIDEPMPAIADKVLSLANDASLESNKDTTSSSGSILDIFDIPSSTEGDLKTLMPTTHNPTMMSAANSSFEFTLTNQEAGEKSVRPSYCYSPHQSLNQAMIVNESICSTGHNKSIIEHGTWYKMPIKTVPNMATKELSVMDDINSNVKVFDPRHSTPARGSLKQTQRHFCHQSSISPVVTTPPTCKEQNSCQESTGLSIPTPTVQIISSINPEKPPYTYGAMIATAIHHSHSFGLSLTQIKYSLIMMFPFFSGSYKGWKSSLRPCLKHSKFLYSLTAQADSIWCIDYSELTPAIFARRGRRTRWHGYKEYLHEQLGLSPVTCEAGDEKCKDSRLSLPPRPCFSNQSPMFDDETEDDFLNARKESAATLAPSIPTMLCDTDEDRQSQPFKRRKIDYKPITPALSITQLQKQTVAVEPTLKPLSTTEPTPNPSASIKLPPASTLINFANYSIPLYQNSFYNHPYNGFHENHSLYSNSYGQQSTYGGYNQGTSADNPGFYDGMTHQQVRTIYDNALMNQWWWNSANSYNGNGATDLASLARYGGQMMSYNNLYSAPLNLTKQTADTQDCDIL